ncbi:hypothetical protein CDAR_305971 [Caerostris darwini]|uniref:Uncharacterized protein n=1 Tax=Caerostris darwini TaxID=1538125 RepID=A0AAV4VR44_9ARAC|nr:hypothetical protein CDAR_305971 [Caerostris darwini]
MCFACLEWGESSNFVFPFWFGGKSLKGSTFIFVQFELHLPSLAPIFLFVLYLLGIQEYRMNVFFFTSAAKLPIDLGGISSALHVLSGENLLILFSPFWFGGKSLKASAFLAIRTPPFFPPSLTPSSHSFCSSPLGIRVEYCMNVCFFTSAAKPLSIKRGGGG